MRAPLLHKDESGSILIEMILVLPMMFIMTMFVLEYSYVLEQKQQLATLNREATGMAFRECAGVNTDQVALGCLERVRVRMQTEGHSVFGRTPEIILGFYERRNPDTVRLGITPLTGVTDLLNTTRFTANDAKFGTAQFNAAMGTTKDGRALIGEVFLQYRPRLLSKVPFVWDLSVTTFYDVIVYTAWDMG